eukprot:5094289-Pyramimonas_sp.AAC.1
MDEGANALSFEHATLFLDLTKFYDSVSFVLLLQAGLNIGLPAIILLLEVGHYSSPRLLKKGHVISDALVVSRSIVAGSGHGVALAKVMLQQLLGEVNRACPPTGLWSYIDDIVGRAEGKKQQVIDNLDASADAMATGLKKLRLKISDKTKLVASSDDIGVELQRRLVRKGIPVQFARSTVDLGSDADAGRRRTAPRMMKRRAQARRRQRRVMRLRQLPKTRFITKKLFSTGVLPAA